MNCCPYGVRWFSDKFYGALDLRWQAHYVLRRQYIEMSGYIEERITGTFQHRLPTILQVKTLQNKLDGVLEVHGNTEWAIGFVLVVAELLHTEAGQHEHRTCPGSETGAHIANAIADKNGVVEINAQFVTRL